MTVAVSMSMIMTVVIMMSCLNLSVYGITKLLD